MNLPDWRTHDSGTKIRVALWLAQEVGEGGIFTKQQLRESFPGTEQIDRRMRDLRDHEWVIKTATQDASLRNEELRLSKIGEPVWSPKARKDTRAALSRAERDAIFQRAGFVCEMCGIAAGDRYPDGQFEYARLQIARNTGSENTRFAVTCDRCKTATRASLKIEDDELLASIPDNHRWILELDPDEIQKLSRSIATVRTLKRRTK